MHRPTPRRPVPALRVSTTTGDLWDLAGRRPAGFSMIVVYRGLHCPICKTYLRDLDARMDDFAARGVDVIAVSTDTNERAEKAQQQWELKKLPVAYGLSIASAREWGLYVSRGIKETEPVEFAEPGIFLVKPDGTLYCASFNTMPYARPSFQDILGAVDFVTKNNYPARGEA